MQGAYRKLFAVGILCGLVGVALWPLYLYGQIDYPIQIHAHLMVLGLFLGFVSGFLMTALPRMSGTTAAAPWESLMAITILGTAGLCALFGKPTVGYAVASAQFCFLGIFASRRFLRRSQNPPVGFMFVPVGLMWGFFACILLSAVNFGVVIEAWPLALARIGLQQGFLLNLIVGLGSRMIPFLTHIQTVDPTQRRQESYWKPLIFLVLLNATFVAEGLAPSPWLYLFRALIMGVAAIQMFGIFKPRLQKTYTGLGIRLSVWSIVLGYALIFIFAGYQLALLHLVFIGGYSLLTFMIATRVVLAHGGHSLDIEKKSMLIVAVFSLILVAAGLRASSFILMASVTWILAIVLWMIGVGKFIFPDLSKGASQ